jgi:hypothetical protein
VGLTLAPFVSREVHEKIFRTSLFENKEIIGAIEELTGLRDHKPFECVGTLGESRDAVVLTLAQYEDAKESTPRGLVDIASALSSKGLLPTVEQARATLRAWNDDHELPPTYGRSLQSLLREVL